MGNDPRGVGRDEILPRTPLAALKMPWHVLAKRYLRFFVFVFGVGCSVPVCLHHLEFYSFQHGCLGYEKTQTGMGTRNRASG